MSVHYAFIKDGHVAEIHTFAAEDQKTANDVVAEFGYDSAVFVGESVPAKHSSYDGTTFTEPTLDYLYSIGVSNCLLYTSPSPRDRQKSRMPSSA